MTNESTNIECPELEQMRAQYEMLKQSIDDHVQVKYYQLQKAMHKDMNRHVKWLKIAFWLLILTLPLSIYNIFSDPEYEFNRSNIFHLVLSIIGLVTISYQLRTFRSFQKNIETNPLDHLRKLRAHKFSWKNSIIIAVMIPVIGFGYGWFMAGNAFFHQNLSYYLIHCAIPALLCYLVYFGSLLWAKHRTKDYMQLYDELEELKKMQ